MAEAPGAPAEGLGTLLDAQGKEVEASGLGKKSVALYFAGEWCPMCRDFTPELKAFTDGSPEKQVVFVSSDFSSEEFEHHRSTMGEGYLAVPYGSAKQDELKRSFRIWGGREKGTFGEGRRSGLPSLVVVDAASGAELQHLDAEAQGKAVLEKW
mmetsp:Transcript_7400/g.23213  ORF Transcript_7400/g.23213 Transcript_7400/m.23213 type:complete len:154 (-) Transcript_7400:77-538(-)